MGRRAGRFSAGSGTGRRLRCVLPGGLGQRLAPLTPPPANTQAAGAARQIGYGSRQYEPRFVPDGGVEGGARIRVGPRAPGKGEGRTTLTFQRGPWAPSRGNERADANAKGSAPFSCPRRGLPTQGRVCYALGAGPLEEAGGHGDWQGGGFQPAGRPVEALRWPCHQVPRGGPLAKGLLVWGSLVVAPSLAVPRWPGPPARFAGPLLSIRLVPGGWAQHFLWATILCPGRREDVGDCRSPMASRSPQCEHRSPGRKVAG